MDSRLGRMVSASTLLLTILVILGLPGEGAAQRLLSPEAARELVRALEVAELEVIAAAGPAEPGTFVAALRVRGGLPPHSTSSSCRTPAPTVSRTLSQRGGVDVLYEDGVSQTLFNGEPKAQKLKPAQYAARLAAADARYARLLTLLTASAREEPAAPSNAGD